MKRLSSMAHGRSGDKGAHANVAIIAYDQEGYDWLCDFLTEDRVSDWFRDWHPTKVTRYRVDNLFALNFLIKDVLDGGASTSLQTDNQGKTFALSLLSMPIPS